MNALQAVPRLRNKARALCGLGLAAAALFALSPPAARAQYGGYPGSGGGWVPSDADGNPALGGGSAALVGTGKKTDVTPDGTYKHLTDWWLSAYSPHDPPDYDPYYQYSFGGLGLSSDAHNYATDSWGGRHGYFDPVRNWGDRPLPSDTPPDITGSVTAKKDDTLTTHFVWTGDPSQVPDHADFLLSTHVSAGASVDYGQSGLASGLSATASASLEKGGDVTASASGPGPGDSQSKDGKHLIRVTPDGTVATVSLKGSVSTDTSHGLPYATWIDGRESSPGAGDAAAYYAGPGAGPTSASAGANVSATAENDD